MTSSGVLPPQRRLAVSGTVQGVGFRPYVWRLATELGLAGWVCNDGAGVVIHIGGSAEALDRFTERLPLEVPPLARVDGLIWQESGTEAGLKGFEIRESQRTGTTSTMIGSDSAVCPDCLEEMFNPAAPRWRYPFINCTHCGPRYTLTHALPYDRAQTSMAGFHLCPDCQTEYGDPADRRFHAEVMACPQCGPDLWLADADGEVVEFDDPIAETLTRIQLGAIVALKGVGGFHLVCDARNGEAVQRLRQRKQRDERPFAIMAANTDSLQAWAEIDEAEAALMNSVEHPIVLLRKRSGADSALPGIAPGLSWLGAMLPYTPLHWLLFHEAAGQPAGNGWTSEPQPLALVMTSANPGGEPLVFNNEEALERLDGIADAYLFHDRDIVVRCDDSVVRSEAGSQGQFQFIRRARGYTPQAIPLPRSGPSVVALGGQFKNTICITRGNEAFLSQHIGGLNNPATCTMQEEVVEHLLSILEVRPEAIACDLHPDFFSTQLAEELAGHFGVPLITVQHHHAHLAAIAAEHGHQGPLLGLALDGVGLGDDDEAWGGELMLLEDGGYRRLGHLQPLALPGGDVAAREPWRMAASVLFALGREQEIAQRFANQSAAARLSDLLARGLNSPTSSSMGRWFDAAAGLLRLCPVMSFEGQAAMMLEGMAETAGEQPPLAGGYRLSSDGQLELLPLLAWLANAPSPEVGAAVFHSTLAAALSAWLIQAARQNGVTSVALSGGCFLNHLLTTQLLRYLAAAGLQVMTARLAPPNDGGLSLGQAWVAIEQLTRGDSV